LNLNLIFLVEITLFIKHSLVPHDLQHQNRLLHMPYEFMQDYKVCAKNDFFWSLTLATIEHFGG